MGRFLHMIDSEFPAGRPPVRCAVRLTPHLARARITAWEGTEKANEVT